MKKNLLLTTVLLTVVLASCTKKESEKITLTFACDKQTVAIGEELTIKAKPNKETGQWKVKVTQENGDALAQGMLTSGDAEATYKSNAEAKFKFGQAKKYKIKCTAVSPTEGTDKEFTITVTAPPSP